MPQSRGTGATPILLVSLPRSGSTWVSKVLAAGGELDLVHEPDNEKENPLAFRYKRGLHRFPCLTDDDATSPMASLFATALEARERTWLSWRIRQRFARHAETLERLIGEKTGFVYVDDTMNRVADVAGAGPVWAAPLLAALCWSAGRGRGSARVRLVKSVHSVLSAGWLSRRMRVRVVLLLRNPFSLYASYQRLRMPDAYRHVLHQAGVREMLLQHGLGQDIPRSYDEAVIQQLMFMLWWCFQQQDDHPDWLVVSHDRLCRAPAEEFASMFDALGLTWTANVSETLEAHNRKGSGFSTQRVTAEQPRRWRGELDAATIARIADAAHAWGLHDPLIERVDSELADVLRLHPASEGGG